VIVSKHWHLAYDKLQISSAVLYKDYWVPYRRLQIQSALYRRLQIQSAFYGRLWILPAPNSAGHLQLFLNLCDAFDFISISYFLISKNLMS
jgi:hypothetical protein